MLENLRNKMAVSSSSNSSLTAPPSLSRTSSDSSDSNNDLHNDANVVSPPLPTTLRQRSTLVDHQETGSLTSSEDGSESNDKFDKASASSSSSILGSVMGLASNAGASSFLLGPHRFSTSELKPPRSRKASRDYSTGEDDHADGVTLGVVSSSSSTVESGRLNMSSGLNKSASTMFRRMQSPSSSNLSSRGSSFMDVDLESGGDQRDDALEVVPLMSSSSPSKMFSPRRRNTQMQSNNSSLNKSNNSNNKIPNASTAAASASSTNNSHYAFNLRSREQTIIKIIMELRMAYVDIVFLLFTTFYQFFHSAVTNIAYYQHAQLNAANRIPLKDIAFDLLPPLDGDLWIISEYFLYAILFLSLFCVLSNLFLSWNAPHGRPIYTLQIVRRMGMTWIVCQTLRMISFLITTLPGASRQCRYSMPEGLTSEEILGGPAPDEGNPAGWAPPSSLTDILFRVDAQNGCGDLMFSSHTIYTMTFVCIVFKYFNFKWLKLVMASLQIGIVPFILAARKHYSVDVFTALYVTPLVFEILWIYFPDRDTSVDLAKYYGIRFYLAEDEEDDSFTYVVSVWGREYYAILDELPVDLKEQGSCLMKKLSPTSLGKGVEHSRSVASIV